MKKWIHAKTDRIECSTEWKHEFNSESGYSYDIRTKGNKRAVIRLNDNDGDWYYSAEVFDGNKRLGSEYFNGNNAKQQACEWADQFFEQSTQSEVTASNNWAKYRLAQDTLKKYSKEQIDYVKDCYDEVLRDISDHYTWDENDGDAPQIHTNVIKTDYLIGAIEDDLMEEEDFEDIYTALETLGEREAMAYA